MRGNHVNDDTPPEPEDDGPDADDDEAVNGDANAVPCTSACADCVMLTDWFHSLEEEEKEETQEEKGRQHIPDESAQNCRCILVPKSPVSRRRDLRV